MLCCHAELEGFERLFPSDQETSLATFRWPTHCYGLRKGFLGLKTCLLFTSSAGDFAFKAIDLTALLQKGLEKPDTKGHVLYDSIYVK